MSFINATLWNDLQSSNATNEKRFAPLGLVDSVKDSTPGVDFIMPSELEKMRTISSLRNLKIPVIVDQQVTVTQSPGFTIPSNLEESANYFFQPFDVFSGFRHYPAAYQNNQIDSEFAVQQKMKNVAYAMGQTIEGIVQSQLELRKTQLLNFTDQVSYAGNYNFNSGTDILEVDLAAQEGTMFYALENLMEANELGGDYRLVTSRAGLVRQKAEMLQNRANNAVDKENLGMFPMTSLYESSTIDAGSDIFNGYMFRNGSVGFVENFPFDFRNGTEIGGAKWDVTDVELPFTRMRANVFTNKFASNAQSMITAGADSNLNMTHGEEMGIWHRFYMVYEYNSDLATRANTVVKLKGLTTTV
jgi:hypothetical protein